MTQRIVTTFVLGGIASFALIGCSGGSKPGTDSAKATGSSPTASKSVPPFSLDDPKSLFPFKEGNSWVYEVQVEQQIQGQNPQGSTTEMEYRVTKVINEGKVTRAIISVYQGTEKKDEQEWAVDDTGIYQLSIRTNRVAYNPRLPVVRFPLKDQDKFQWKGTGLTSISKVGQMTYNFKNDGTIDADTAMGSMKCVYMESGGSFKTNEGIEGIVGVNAWFAPGVGMARYRQRFVLKQGSNNITLRLKSYNVKK